jgi:hypothetical protein
MSYMRDIPVNNREILRHLNKYKDILVRDKEAFEKNFHLSCQEQKDQKDWWTGEEHKNEIVNQRTRHEGFPDVVYGYEMSVGRKGHEFFSQDCHPNDRLALTNELSFANEQIMTWLGVRNNALTAYYPPNGFISWHNNANAAAYNLIFTWSEEGNGSFSYVDPETKKIVNMPDKAGWQCKAAYFGHYGEEERLFYHAARTEGWRITVSFTFDVSKLSEELREDVLEEISAEV